MSANSVLKIQTWSMSGAVLKLRHSNKFSYNRKECYEYAKCTVLLPKMPNNQLNVLEI